LKYFTLPTMWTEQLLGRRRGLCLGLGLSGKVQSSRWSKQGTGARGVVLGWGSVESGSTRSSWHSTESTTWSWRGGMKESCVIFWKHDARSTFWQIGGAVCFPRLRLSAALLGAFLQNTETSTQLPSTSVLSCPHSFPANHSVLFRLS
jgi:hypothetical protein